MKHLSRFIINNQWWIDPILTAIIAFSSAFLDFDPSHLTAEHPVQHALLSKWILPTLPWVLFITVALLVLGKFFDYKSKPEMHKLESENQRLYGENQIINEQVRNLFDGYLYNLASRLEFGTQKENCERISLYVHDGNKTFVPCGRFSANPAYRQPRRTAYPDTEGCIAQGWQNGWHFDDKLPCPVNQKSNYVDYVLNEYRVPRNTTRAINMKSRLFAVMAVTNRSESVAVLVLESTDAKRFMETEVKSLLEQQNEFLGQMVRDLDRYIPRPSIAKKGGV